ncbi:MAG: endonuclease/exonuclease/phosphatase family protein [Rikenellaceae bacterium]|nr:endonuclease/exonuclease/phosphatase family protein [Rikenellaceae bacterium]
MIKGIITSLLLTVATLVVTAQNHTVVFYNIENAFDTINDPTTADEDMLPLSDRGWNDRRYNAKLQLVATTLASITADHPTLIGLAEIENSNVLRDLTQTLPLRSTSYNICHYDSPDERGIDVALLYRPDRFHYAGSRAIRSEADPATRDILTVWGQMDGHSTFIAVVHWPSRIGGVKFTEPKRRASARQLREIVDSVMVENPATRIIVMGDMNDNPRDKSISEDLRATARSAAATDLYNPFTNTRRGSSVYDGRWNQYDNIVVSQNIPLRAIDGRRKAKVYRHPSLLDRAGKPLPTYSGTDYKGGASDHLPIYVIIEADKP